MSTAILGVGKSRAGVPAQYTEEETCLAAKLLHMTSVPSSHIQLLNPTSVPCKEAVSKLPFPMWPYYNMTQGVLVAA